MKRVSTGIVGLDNILKGGLIPARAYLVRGGPGVGKTICGMHFLNAGLTLGEPALFISLDQTEDQVITDSRALGFKLEQADFLDLTAGAETFAEMHTYDIFSPPEVERDPITKMIADKITTGQPRRIFIDGLSQFRHLASDAFHLRRLIQSFFRFATQSGGTLLVSCDEIDNGRDRDMQSVADGVINLEWTGAVRTMHVSKFRGSDFQHGAHVMRIAGEGIVVFPIAA